MNGRRFALLSDPFDLFAAFLILSGIFFSYIFVIEIYVSGKEAELQASVYIPDLSITYSCLPTDDNEVDYFDIYYPFLLRHGFEVRGSPEDFVGKDRTRRMISFWVTHDHGVEHRVDLSSEPPTIRDLALEKDIQSLISKTLPCSIVDVQRHESARIDRILYDRVFQTW